MPPDRSGPWPAALPAAAPDAFELWLRRGLQARFAAIVAEPLPPALLELATRTTEATEDRFVQRVRERAYFLWLAEGRPDGRALEHWMAAFMHEIAAGGPDPRRPPVALSVPDRAGRARSDRG